MSNSTTQFANTNAVGFTLFSDEFKKMLTRKLKNDNVKLAQFLKGDVGIGKSTFIETIAKENGWGFYCLNCDQLYDRSDAMGQDKIRDASGKAVALTTYPHQQIKLAMDEALKDPSKKVLLFYDEYNRAPGDVICTLMSTITDRMLGTDVIPPNVKIIAAGNDTDNGTNNLPDAALNRFSFWACRADAQLFMKHVEAVFGSVQPDIKNVLTAHPDLIVCHLLNADCDTDEDGNAFVEVDDYNDRTNLSAHTNPRTLFDLQADLSTMSDAELFTELSTPTTDRYGADSNMLRDDIMGVIGNTEFAIHLLASITNRLANVQSQVSSFRAPGKPQFWDDLVQTTDRQTRQTLITSMTDADKSTGIIYGLCTRDDAYDIVYDLVSAFNKPILEAVDMSTFMSAYNANKLNEDNAKAITDNTGAMLNATFCGFFGH